MFWRSKKEVRVSDINVALSLLDPIVLHFSMSESFSKAELLFQSDKRLLARFKVLQAYFRGVIDALAVCSMSSAGIIKISKYEHLSLSAANEDLKNRIVGEMKKVFISSDFYKGFFVQVLGRKNENPLIAIYSDSIIDLDSSALKFPEVFSLGIETVMGSVQAMSSEGKSSHEQLREYSVLTEGLVRIFISSNIDDVMISLDRFIKRLV